MNHSQYDHYDAFRK